MITGLCAFPITPAAADGTIDVAGLDALLRRLLAAKVDAIGLLGSTGSYPYLTRTQRRRTVEAAIAATGGETPLLVAQSGSNRALGSDHSGGLAGRQADCSSRGYDLLSFAAQDTPLNGRQRCDLTL